MSINWNPFKKAFSGRRNRSEDVDFEREINKLKQMQAVSKRMYKDMKNINEVMTGYLRYQQHLFMNVKSSSLARSEPLKEMVRIFHNLLSKVEVLTLVMQSLQVNSRELKANQDCLFVDPIKRMNGVYKQVELQAKQREQKLQEYERQQAKLDKQGRRVAGTMQTQQQQSGIQARLEQNQRAVTAARGDYERIHDRLMLEIPQLLEERVHYFDICLSATLMAQAFYYQECSGELLTGLKKLQEDFEDVVKSEEEIELSTTSHLTSIRMLSIVGVS